MQKSRMGCALDRTVSFFRELFFALSEHCLKSGFNAAVSSCDFMALPGRPPGLTARRSRDHFAKAWISRPTKSNNLLNLRCACAHRPRRSWAALDERHFGRNRQRDSAGPSLARHISAQPVALSRVWPGCDCCSVHSAATFGGVRACARRLLAATST